MTTLGETLARAKWEPFYDLKNANECFEYFDKVV